MITRLYLSALVVTLLLIGTQVPSAAQSADSAATTPAAQSIPDTLLFKIQKAQSVITQIKAADRKKYGITRVRTGLATVKANVAPVAGDMRIHGKAIDARSLANYGLILNDALNELTDYRTLLSRSNNDLQSNLDQVLALSTDSLLNVTSNDTTGKKLYADQLASLKVQLQDAGTRTSARLDTVSRLLADVSGTYLTISTLQTTINERLDKSTENAFRKESPYLWEAPATFSVSDLPERLLASYQGQDKIVNYFFASTWDNRLLLLLLTGLFFVWVLVNYRKARTPSLRPVLGSLRLDNLKPVPVAASLLVLLNLPPLFEPQSPSIYIELTQFLLFLVIIVHLWERFSPHEVRLWLMVGAMYIVLIVINTLVGDSLFMRMGLLGLNAGFMYIGVAFARRLPRQHVSARITRLVTVVYLLLQGLAIVLNIIGRISLAKTVGITAVISLVQLAGLGLFIEVVLEALELQITISACSQGLFSRVNVGHVRRSFKKGLVFIAAALWLIVFFINLGVADEVYNLVSHILTRPRSFGSISFTLSNVLSFSVVIYLSSLLQKNIGLLFGESSLSAADEQVGQLSSVLALVRLVILVAGILLAIAASGISIDKFTVVLGALSVGIGLGMQNIVSNFVSGIILIFEKPFKIGDYVELADKKGRIRDIGIRSSRMITAQGSEVIIPNGDLLSNRLVNWTSSGVYLKTEFVLKVDKDTDLELVQSIMTREVNEIDGAVKNRFPEIIVTTISGDSVELKVQVWISSIYAEVNLKSHLLQRLLMAFKKEGIKLI